MKKIFTAIAMLVVATAASADHRHHHGNYVGPVSPRGHYENRGCDSNCALAVLGTIAIGAVILNETRQPQPVYVPPQPVYVPPPPVYIPPPQIVYVPSDFRCNGGIVISNVYYCPVQR